MNWLFLKLSRKTFLELLRRTLASALIAGTYGMLHDQITYAIAPEYYTHFKFDQFAYADFGQPEPLFVAVIGFLATWWVGAIAGWLLARSSILPDGNLLSRREFLKGLLMILGISFTFAAAGSLHGRFDSGMASGLRTFWLERGVQDVDAFLWVGSIHTYGYIGAGIGLLAILVSLRRAVRRNSG